MVLRHSLGDCPVQFGQLFVQNYEQKVESTQKRVRQPDILVWWQIFLIFSVNRICRCNHCAPSIQLAMNSGLGDCNRLLFHDFVECDSIHFIHFVKLIDAHYSSISQHHGSCLKRVLISLMFFLNSCCKTHTGGSSSSRGDAEGGQCLNISEELRLGCGRVSDHEDIDVPPDSCSILE